MQLYIPKDFIYEVFNCILNVAQVAATGLEELPGVRGRGGGREKPPHARRRGGGQEEQPHVQGGVAAQAQEGLEEPYHVEGQEGWQ